MSQNAGGYHPPPLLSWTGTCFLCGWWLCEFETFVEVVIWKSSKAFKEGVTPKIISFT